MRTRARLDALRVHGIRDFGLVHPKGGERHRVYGAVFLRVPLVRAHLEIPGGDEDLRHPVRGREARRDGRDGHVRAPIVGGDHGARAEDLRVQSGGNGGGNFI